jgi:hypothetical protein
MLAALADKPRAFAAAAAFLLLLDARRARAINVRNKAAASRRPFLLRRKRRSTRMLGRQDPVVDSLTAQQPVQPEAVIVRLVTAYHSHATQGRHLCVAALARDQRKQRRYVPACEAGFADLVGRRRMNRDEPRRFAQFQSHEQSGRLLRDGRPARARGLPGRSPELAVGPRTLNRARLSVAAWDLFCRRAPAACLVRSNTCQSTIRHSRSASRASAARISERAEAARLAVLLLRATVRTSSRQRS